MAHRLHDPMVNESASLAKKLDAIAWGVFFIWIGIAFLADVGWGVGLLGVGLIAVGTQMGRRYSGLPVERFGLAIGIVFTVWAVWELLRLHVHGGRMGGSLLPVLSIAVGVVLVVSAVARTPRE
jgi:hypothetical protein